MASAVRERRASGPHRAVVDNLARDLELPVEHVEKVYLAEMARIESGARIKTFLTVLTVGRVRHRLRRERRADT
jgi:hypothetical protein